MRPDGSLTDEDEVGEVVLRSASLMRGYWQDAVATAAAVDADGWYRTGDLGCVRGGRLFLDGRRRDRIIRGGENISPLEVEQRLLAHEGVEAVAVVGVPDDDLGQQALAVIVRRAGHALTADDARAWVAQRLAHFKVPAHVVFVPELPYTATGKLLKTELERSAPDLLARAQ